MEQQRREGVAQCCENDGNTWDNRGKMVMMMMMVVVVVMMIMIMMIV